jgi:hypothetical protein
MKFALSLLLATVISSLGYAAGDHDAKTGKKISAMEIQFSPGMASLTVDQKKQIKDFAQKAKALNRDVEISVAAWSDQPFPAKGQDLSKDQQKLAGRRLDKIEEYLEKEVDFKGDVDTYNMAERANWLARAFETEGAEIKSVFAQKDEEVSEDVLRSKYNEFKKRGKQQKAVLVMTAKKGTF